MVRVMYIFLIQLILMLASSAFADTAAEIRELAQANGFKPSKRVVRAIVKASERYQVDALELTSIAIVESGLGLYARESANPNGTIDKGLFQINTVNYPKCEGLNLDTPEGSALCAAKLLADIKERHEDYLGRYHSKTPKLKKRYLLKVNKVLSLASRD